MPCCSTWKALSTSPGSGPEGRSVMAVTASSLCPGQSCHRLDMCTLSAATRLVKRTPAYSRASLHSACAGAKSPRHETRFVGEELEPQGGQPLDFDMVAASIRADAVGHGDLLPGPGGQDGRRPGRPGHRQTVGGPPEA